MITTYLLAKSCPLKFSDTSVANSAPEGPGKICEDLFIVGVAGSCSAVFGKDTTSEDPKI